MKCTIVDSEVLANISNIDNRLGYVKEALEPDDFAKELNKVREKVAPSIKKQFATGYNQLIAEQQITSLRQAMNSSPLRIEFGQSLIQNLKESGIDPVKVNKFYDQLAEVQRVTESLFDTLSYVASTSVQDDKKQSDYNNRRKWGYLLSSSHPYMLWFWRSGPRMPLIIFLYGAGSTAMAFCSNR